MSIRDNLKESPKYRDTCNQIIRNILEGKENNIDDNNPYSATWSITALQNKIDEIDNQRDVIINKYAFEKYFTQNIQTGWVRH